MSFQGFDAHRTGSQKYPDSQRADPLETVVDSCPVWLSHTQVSAAKIAEALIIAFWPLRVHLFDCVIYAMKISLFS
jgi:hypothetical protein